MNRHDTVRAVLEGRPRRPGAAGSAFAPVNIALVKYWGKRDAELNLPVTGSLSVALPDLGTHTEVETAPADRVEFNGEALASDDPRAVRIRAFLDPFRCTDGPGFAVRTRNTVPTAAGLASSASGFAALATALDRLFGWGLPRRALSILARLGSGSACRSVFPGFVEWHAGERADGLDSFARPLDTTWPGLCVGLLLVETGGKPVGSRDAMARTVATSPLYPAWPAAVAADLDAIRVAVSTRDLAALGRTAEANALAMHATMIAARPAVCYWRPETIAAMARVAALRDRGLPVWFTMDAGPNLKLLYEESSISELEAALPGLRTVRCFPLEGAARRD